MSQVITCPNCDKKLALKNELQGRALICPQCKSRFTAPANESQPVPDLFATSDPAPSSGGPDSFLSSLAPVSGPAAAKTATKTSTIGRPAMSAPSATGVTTSAASRMTASRAKSKNDQMMLVYIGGGVAAAVLVVILLAVAMSSGGGSGGTKKKNENIRFGLTETQRKHFFKDLFHAVDEIGAGASNDYKACRDEWGRLGRELKLSDQQVLDTFKEGMDSGWEQPAMVATQDQKNKTNRLDFIRTMNETHRNPVMR